MSVIDDLRTYMLTYSNLKANAPVWVNHLGNVPIEYNIVPLAGSIIVEYYINGSSLRAFPFAFQSVEDTIDNIAGLEIVGFYEAFSDWLESQTDSNVLPVLDAGKSATLIEALGWGILLQTGASKTGIYQVQCQLEYKQEA